MNKETKNGIYFHKKLGKFMASINFRGERLHVGYFSTAEEAFAARGIALLELYGNKESIPTTNKRKTKLEKTKELLRKEKESFISEEDKKLLEEAKPKDLREIIT